MHFEKKLSILADSMSECNVRPLHFWNETMNKPYTRYSGCGKNGPYAKIDKLIQSTPAELCLTSNFLYVRKAKAFFEQEK